MGSDVAAHPLVGIAATVGLSVSTLYASAAGQVLLATYFTAVLVEWAARLAHNGRDFVTDLAETRLGRLALRACTVLCLGLLYPYLALPVDDKYLRVRWTLLAVMVPLAAVVASTLWRARRRVRVEPVAD